MPLAGNAKASFFPIPRCSNFLDSRDSLIKKYVCTEDSLGWEEVDGIEANGVMSAGYYPSCGERGCIFSIANRGYNS